jgi:hypothetical protein
MFEQMRRPANFEAARGREKLALGKDGAIGEKVSETNERRFLKGEHGNSQLCLQFALAQRKVSAKRKQLV